MRFSWEIGGEAVFSLVDMPQPCVTWNKVNTASRYSERVYELKGDYLGTHDIGDLLKGFY